MTQADVLPALDRHEHTRPAFYRARAGLGHGRRWIGFYPVDLFWFSTSSTSVMLTTTASLSERTRTHSRVHLGSALIS
jgi:hypothetical protein